MNNNNNLLHVFNILHLCTYFFQFHKFKLIHDKLSSIADKNDSDEENELLNKETSTSFNKQCTDDKVDDQPKLNKNQKVNIVK